MPLRQILSKIWIGICAGLDLALGITCIAIALSQSVRHSSSRIYSLLAFSIMLTISGYLAISHIRSPKHSPSIKIGFAATGVLHVILAMLANIGPTAIPLMSALIIIGVTYVFIAFKLHRHPPLCA